MDYVRKNNITKLSKRSPEILLHILRPQKAFYIEWKDNPLTVLEAAGIDTAFDVFVILYCDISLQVVDKFIGKGTNTFIPVRYMEKWNT